jgi:DNA-binding transcriptional MerR regulator
MLSKPKQISLFDFDEPVDDRPEKKSSARKRPDPGAAVPSTDTATVVDIPELLTDPVKDQNSGNNLSKAEAGADTPEKNAKGNDNSRKQKSTRGRKSIKELSAAAHLVDVPPDEVLFQKSYYAIGKVAEMFKVNQSLLRLWENEFDILKPKKNGKGDRYFRPEDVKNIQLIYHLTRERKYTMEGAKEYFRNNKKADEKFARIESLKKIKSFLLELKANL